MPDHLLPDILDSHQRCAIYAICESVFTRTTHKGHRLQGTHLKLCLLCLAIHKENPLLPHELATRIGCSPSTVPLLLDYLMSEDLVTREGDSYIPSNYHIRLRMPNDALVPPSLYDLERPRSTGHKRE